MPRTVKHLQYSLSSQKRRKLEDFVNKLNIILLYFLEKPKKRNDTPWPKDTESKIQSLTGLSGKYSNLPNNRVGPFYCVLRWQIYQKLINVNV